MNQDLLNYVQGARQAGTDAETIKNSLLAAGWPAADVGEALAGAVPSAAPAAAVVAAAPVQAASAAPATVQQPAPVAGMPAEIKGLNWGAFLLTFIWGIGNRVWISLLVFVPVINMIWPIVLLIKGNEWAWKARPWASVEEFHRVQRKWAVVGLILLAVSIVLAAVSAFVAATTLSKELQ